MTENSLQSEIASLIKRLGKIPFAEFMGLALYHPKDGYYTSPEVFGAEGDFYTSPSAHPVFGALLTVQLKAMWEALDKPNPFHAIEPGAGNGILAQDILDYADKLSDEFANSLLYVSLDRYCASDIVTTRPHQHEQVKSADIPLKGVVGCLLSNELIDSFPVHRFQIQNSQVWEMYVTLDDEEKFVEVFGSPSTPALTERIKALGFPLPEGFRGEVNLNICPWIQEVSNALERGFVLTIDYGHLEKELYSAERRNGTFQTYYRHTEGSSPYQRIGRQDMTAHVDFSLVQSEGAKSGLRTLSYMTQAEFLHGLGFDEMLHQIYSRNLRPGERNANLMALQELVNPDGLGGFKVLIQEKDTGPEGYDSLSQTGSDTPIPAPPIKTPQHISLMEGRYPHQEWNLDALWPFDDKQS